MKDCSIAANGGAMRLFCLTRNYQVTTDFNGQNGVLARVSSWRFYLPPLPRSTKNKSEGLGI